MALSSQAQAHLLLQRRGGMCVHLLPPGGQCLRQQEALELSNSFHSKQVKHQAEL